MKKTMAKIALAASMLGGGIAASTADAAPAPGYHLMYDATYSLPRAVAGTACPAQFQLARTAWNTILGCAGYITKAGTPALHWSYLKVNLANGTYCTSDGYLYNGSIKTYSPATCQQAPVAPRLPGNILS